VLELPSPFPEGNLCIAAVDTVSTRCDDRNERTYRKIATCIAATVSAKAGNYICYFPSYAFMESVMKAFCRKYPNVKTVVQKRCMTLAQKESFLSAFKNDTGILRVGFCVLGGSFSEGVDLPGSRLIGSIVVGTGIPGLSNERNIIRDYYEEKNGRGYDYSYSFPGMNSVLQAAGRVIRRDTDRGVVVLIDDRYSEPLYAHLFPEHWESIKFAGNPASLAEIVRRFWKKHEENEKN
jgi:Rad3-related DNA helicase